VPLHFPSGARWVRERLGISERKARALVALERKARTAPGLDQAYRAGELSWLRSLTLLPVVSPRTTPAWIERAREVTIRRLADEVEWAIVAGAPVEPIAPPPPGAVLERQMGAPCGGESTDAEVVFRAPASVVALLRTAILAFTHPPDSLVAGFERLLMHAKAEWEAQPRHRDPIFRRDGWRCAVPVCTSRRDLQAHHLVFRSRGGDDAPENRITLCAWHHLRGVHAGRVRAAGQAPHAVSWELGVRAGRPPLLRLEGDRYAPRTETDASSATRGGAERTGTEG
jgi:hypothetical protein